MKAMDDLLKELCDPTKINLENLNVLRSALADLQHKNRLEFSTALQNSDLKPLFAVLSNVNGEELTAFCEVLRTLLECVPPTQLLNRYEGAIEEALKKGNTDIQKLAIYELGRCARDGKACTCLVSKTILLVLVIEQLGSEQLATQVKQLILDLTKNSSEAVKIIFEDGSPLLRKLESVQHLGSVENIRVFELFCEVAHQSEENCSKMKPRLFSIIKTFESEKTDVLAILNYIEILITLLSQPFSLEFLRSTSVIPCVKDMLTNQDDPMASLYTPSVLSFFGTLGVHSPTVLLQDFAPVVHVMLGLCTDSPHSTAAVTSLALLGRTSEGKRQLDRLLPSVISNYMHFLGNTLECPNRKPEQKLAALHALASVIELEENDQLDLIAIVEKWLWQISTNPLQLLWKCAKVPFEEERLAALKVLKFVGLLPKGRQSLLQLPGFFEWLLDRNTEPDKAGKEGKHGIVAAILEEGNSIDPVQLAALRKFYLEGPFYSPEEVAIVTDGAS